MTRSFILIAVAGCFLAWDARAQVVDFERDIRPIFEAQCLSCHNDGRAESGLSLESYESALKGGTSGKPVLGGTVETNEILQRIQSVNPDERMPFEADALSTESIDLLIGWVEQGTPWPETTAEDQGLSLSGINLWLKRWVMPYLPWLIGLLITVIVIERFKTYASKRKEPLQGLTKWCDHFAKRVTLPIYIIAFLCITIGVMIDQLFALEETLDAVRADRIEAYESAAGRTVFGDPPAPVEPAYPLPFGGTYYRGNNERKVELYNHGHYRTATLELSLIDQQGNVLSPGSAVSGELRIRLLIKRAPGATQQLFSEEIMSGLLLATGYHPEGVRVVAEHAATFSPAAPDAWEAFYPVSTEGRNAPGLIYVYRGNRTEGGHIHTAGMPQLGIVYDLNIDIGTIGTIGKDAKLWMDAIYYPENVVPPAGKGMVPWNEWFSSQPIPEIVGENTKDPEMLGITSPDGSPNQAEYDD
jgi:hypothetical protein